VRARAILWRAAAAVAFSAVAVIATLILAHKRGWWEPTVPGGQATVRLISAEQYLNTMHDLFGEDIAVDVSFAPPQRRQGLIALGAATADITPGALEQFDRAARTVAMQVVDETHRAVLVPCTPVSADAEDVTCARKFFTRVGRFLYRRPLTQMELNGQVETADAIAQQSADFYTGLGYSLAGMLTSPKFLYVTESNEPDPEHPGQVRLDAYAKATRLSLFLWNALPDEALLEAAELGELQKQGGLQRQIDRMLGSPRLEQGVRAFFADFLSFDRFDTLSKDPVIYPVFTRRVAQSAEEQALRLITDHLLTREGDYRDLFTTSRTFVDAALGPLYGVPIPNPQGWIPYELDPKHSAGLLTSLSFVALNSHPGRSSPTRRGRAIREFLLCQKVPDPPPNVSFNVFEDPDRHFRTTRERLERHSTDPVCAGCHKLTDPMGLALENFDGAGTFHTEENGVRIDTRGVLDGRPFTDAATLGQALHGQPALGPCLASRLYAYGIGREVTTADRPWLVYIAKRFAVDGYRLPDLLRDIASSRAFFAVSNPMPTTATVAAGDTRSPDQS
jgi:Protein of unknown function (DUF1592)/Protein of unknown function (DUF1588)/Protein of unknown function (DUF1585)/Protein of unknown function (DUF1595)/Protein of unknown function (DUF1587)